MKKICVSIFILLCFLSLNTAFGADMLYRYMHNDHNALIIGKITEKKEYINPETKETDIPKTDSQIPLDKQFLYKIEVSEMIVSDISLNTENKLLKDVPPIIDVYAKDKPEYGIGDNVAISLNQDGNIFKIQNGIYKLTSNDSDTLEVINLEDVSNKEDNAAVEVFLKSRGKLTEFYFNEKGVYLYSAPNKSSDLDIHIYDSSLDKKLNIEITDKNHKINVNMPDYNISQDEGKRKIEYSAFIAIPIFIVFLGIKKYLNKK